MCVHCSAFDVHIDIHGLLQLRRLMKKVRVALDTDRIRYLGLSQDIPVDQISFTDLDIEGPLPDVIGYQFTWTVCGKLFDLSVETYHGRGGAWAGK